MIKPRLNSPELCYIHDEEIAAGFNEYFSTIGSMLSKAIKDCDTDPSSFLTVTHDNIFNFNFITIDEVISAIDLLPLKKSSGLDGISAKPLAQNR